MPWSSIRPHPLPGAARSCVRLQPVRSVSCCLQARVAENFVKNKAKQSQREDVGTWLGASSAVVLSPSACVPSGVTPRSATTIGSAVAGTRRTLVASRWERLVQHARTHNNALTAMRGLHLWREHAHKETYWRRAGGHTLPTSCTVSTNTRCERTAVSRRWR